MYHTCKYTPRVNIPLLRQTRCKFSFTYMYFWLCEHAANIHTYANVSFPLISCEIGSKIKYFCVKSKKHLNHSHFKTNMALIMKFQAHYDFTKILIISYNNAQIHPNVTVQYLKSIPFVPKAYKTCVHISVSDKNQYSSQTKRFIYAPFGRYMWTRCKYIFTCGCKYTYMYNLHTVCKSAHVNGALDVYTILNRIQLTKWTICAFRVLNHHQWSLAKKVVSKIGKRWLKVSK